MTRRVACAHASIGETDSFNDDIREAKALSLENVVTVTLGVLEGLENSIRDYWKRYIDVKEYQKLGEYLKDIFCADYGFFRGWLEYLKHNR